MFATVSAILGTLGLLGLLLIATRRFQRRHSVHPVYARKIAHTGCGLVALGFPWIFDDSWAVIVTCVVASVALEIARRSPGISGDMTGILGRASRGAAGEFGLSLAVALLFVLSQGNPLLYCTPLVIVTLSDPAAAIVGRRYGRRYYQIGRARKTLEGSLAFFGIAVTATLGVLAIVTDLGSVELLLIALFVGLVTSVSEAVASRGEDNLTIPLIAFVALKVSVERSGGDTALYVGLILTTTLILFVLKRRTVSV